MAISECITRIPFFFIKNFGKKGPILDMRKKYLLVILDWSFWTCPLWLSHVLFDQASVDIIDWYFWLIISTSTFD